MGYTKTMGKETAYLDQTEHTYRVKLYHQADPDNPCKNSGQSEYIQVTATDQGALRAQVETETHNIFRGDTCKKCGDLAKVSVEEL